MWKGMFMRDHMYAEWQAMKIASDEIVSKLEGDTRGRAPQKPFGKPTVVLPAETPLFDL